MSVFKRRPDDHHWTVKFKLRGRQYMKTSGTSSKTAARDFESDYRKQILKELAEGSSKPKRSAPLLEDFIRNPSLDDSTDRGGEFWEKFGNAQYSKKPKTQRFYRDRFKVLIRLLGDKRLDRIDNEDLDEFVSTRVEEDVTNATINRDLAALSVALNRARRWRLVAELPVIEKREEREIGVAITPQQEAAYMAAADQDLADFALIQIDTAMMPVSAASLRWSDVHFGESEGWAHGYIFDGCEKTTLRKRELGMTKRLAMRLKERKLAQGASIYVFPADKLGAGFPTPLDTFRSAHKRLWVEGETWRPLTIPEFRIYDFRHTALTRAWEAGADEIALMAMAGWSSFAMAKRYIKNRTEMKSRNVQRMDAYMEGWRKKVGVS